MVKEELMEIMEALKYTSDNPEKVVHGIGPRIIVKENKIINIEKSEGIILDGKEEGDRLKVKMVVKKGYKFKEPIHMCFGITKENVSQIIDVEIVLEENSAISLMSHCSFLKGKGIKHIMNGVIKIGKNARFSYNEYHYHGMEGDILVKPTVKVEIDEGGIYTSNFTLTKGRIGTLDIYQEIDAKKDAIIDIMTRTYAIKDDVVKVDEIVKLNGENAKCIIKSRGAAMDNSKISLKLKIEGNAPYCKGHIDCAEITKGNAEVESIPILVVRDDRARITHEAAIGSVDKKQLETLMAKGLDEDEATEIIVKGMIGDL
ncbi:Iron-sulfur cluster assembly protein SufB [Methanocaldococcus lauensis]|uniref:Iron-sulfur cluster assembly protein SufB n=1 Tax=Methanocaldococcus lauensis TaxID=2546128 RepID=A0A8D6PQA4_9EURY|nr:SufD family Fe-S cluster assembly protein [Methanocaldococcus lauensis]CAB3288051.1 Iron-sulfur cluster assembly protein SufB [Methanocaldococcus lauensis]